MKVFIGSSIECTNIMDKISLWLEDFGCVPQRWNDPGLFIPGDYVYQQLLSIANSVDAAILIFGEDDQTWCRGGIVKSPRDNVLIEYGIFSSILSPKRTIVCRVGDAKMPADMDGIVYVNVAENKNERARLEIKTWAERTKYGLDLVGSPRPVLIPSVIDNHQDISNVVKFITIEPRLIVASDSSSVPHVSSEFLKGRQGGVSMWVELPKFGEGLRHLINNRYLIAHATNNGNIPYRNVVGLCRGPRLYDPPLEPRWKLWVADHNGNKISKAYEDTEALQPGWHLFVLRWNHDLPVIEVLIDGNVCIAMSDYLSCWPTEYAQTVIFGTWPYSWSEFYLNGRTNRIGFFQSWPADEWIQSELERNTPTKRLDEDSS